MYLISSIVSMILVLIVEYFLGTYADFTIVGFRLLEVIPVGCCFIGIALGKIMSMGIKNSKQKIKTAHYIIAALIASVTFFTNGYTWFVCTYVQEGTGFNVNRKGIPLDEFTFVDTNGQKIEMNYMNYYTYLIDESTPSENFVPGGELILKNKEGKKVPTYVIEYIALIATVFLTLKATMSRAIYCERCKQYYTNKTLFTFSKTNYHSEVSELENRIANNDGLKEFVKRSRPKMKDSIFYKAELRYCKECKSGNIIIKEAEKHIINVGELSKNKKIIDTDYVTVQSILED